VDKRRQRLDGTSRRSTEAAEKDRRWCASFAKLDDFRVKCDTRDRALRSCANSTPVGVECLINRMDRIPR